MSEITQRCVAQSARTPHIELSDLPKCHALRLWVDSEPQSHGRAVDRTKLDSRSEVRRAVRERAVFGGGDALMPQRSSCVDSSVCSSRYSCRVASKYAHRSGVLAISASAVRPSRARGPWLDAEPPGGGAGLPGGADEKPQPRPGRPEHSLSAMVPRHAHPTRDAPAVNQPTDLVGHTNNEARHPPRGDPGLPSEGGVETDFSLSQPEVCSTKAVLRGAARGTFSDKCIIPIQDM